MYIFNVNEYNLRINVNVSLIRLIPTCEERISSARSGLRSIKESKCEKNKSIHTNAHNHYTLHLIERFQCNFLKAAIMSN